LPTPPFWFAATSIFMNFPFHRRSKTTIKVC
jgi:hypothetical protein